jgi:hypothetical protein
MFSKIQTDSHQTDKQKIFLFIYLIFSVNTNFTSTITINVLINETILHIK